MLQNAVRPIDDLHKVKTNTHHDVAKGGAELMYKQYIALLLSVISIFDTEKIP